MATAAWLLPKREVQDWYTAQVEESQDQGSHGGIPAGWHSGINESSPVMASCGSNATTSRSFSWARVSASAASACRRTQVGMSMDASPHLGIPEGIITLGIKWKLGVHQQTEFLENRCLVRRPFRPIEAGKRACIRCSLASEAFTSRKNLMGHSSKSQKVLRYGRIMKNQCQIVN